jgi:hypothetical protein
LTPTITLSETSTAGTYSAQYTIQATDPLGTWTISVIAIKDAQSSSASVAVSISGQSLKVVILSPASNAKFNVGEAAIVKATVTLQDGSPVGSSASVGFSKPMGGSMQMGVDLSDPSGKTWAGGYTVLTSDVPADGFVWPIAVSATANGNTGSSAESILLYKTLVVGVVTFGSSSYDVPKDSFAKGETIYVRGVPEFHDGRVASTGTVTFVMSGTSVASSPVSMVYKTSLNAWTGSYTVLSSDLSGSQVVTVSALDAFGNTGSGIHQVIVGGTTQGILVSIISPSPNSVFNRGEAVTISATVTMGGSPVTGASVTATTPTGGTINLTPGAGGTYSAQYTVLSTDPAGGYTVTVTAVKSGQTGSSQVLDVISDSLEVSVSTWSTSAFNVAKDSFVRGDTVYVEAQVTLQDGAVVSGGTVNFEITGTTIAGSPLAMTFSVSVHAWVGSYTLLQTDQNGNQLVNVGASDQNGNSGAGTHAIGVGVPVTAQQPLEAKITFDPQTGDLAVKAVCNAGCVVPTTVSVTNTAHQGQGEDDEGNDQNGDGGLRIYKVADSGGHSLTLNIQVKIEGHQLKAHLVSIQYGQSAPIAAPDNEMTFGLSKHDDEGAGGAKQSISVNELVNAEARFDPAKDLTTIHIESQVGDEGDDGQTLTLNGLWLLDLVTSNGSLSFGYFQAG